MDHTGPSVNLFKIHPRRRPPGRRSTLREKPDMRISQRLKSSLQQEDSIRRTSSMAEIDVRLASKADEYADAFRIAYQVYYPLGYTSYAPSGMRMTPYQFRPENIVLVAYYAGQAVACLSLFEDRAQGLPSDNGWRADLNQLRASRKKIFEVGSLMVLPNCPLRGPGICLALFRQAWMYAHHFRGADTLCAFVQKHHVFFYKKMLTFTNFGETRDYRWNGLNIPEVCALVMNLEGAELEFKRRFDRFGDSPRNLYRWFVHHRRVETEAKLRRALRRRARINLEDLRLQFERLMESSVPLSTAH